MAERKTLSLKDRKFSDAEWALLMEKNLMLADACEKLVEAVTNHKLNSKCATSADVVLWDTVESLIEE